MDLDAIADALARTVEKGTGVTTYPYVPDFLPDLPFAVVQPPQRVTSATFGRGMFEAAFMVTVTVNRINEELGQRTLRNYMSPNADGSVWAVIDAQTDLDGTVARIRVDHAESATYSWGTEQFMAVDFFISVIA